MSKTKILTTSALLTALSVVLVVASKLIPSPWLQGGSITLASMVPVIVVSVIAGTKWGLLSGFVFSLIQMLTGFNVPPTQDFLSFTLVILLDYVIAFTVLGSAGFFIKLFKNKLWSIPFSGAIVTTLRFVCHIISGVLIWGVYANEGQSVLVYSILYNGSYMLPEIIITTVVLSLLIPKLKKYISL